VVLKCAAAFVPAWFDYGPFHKTVLGFGMHMAEGGGTVGYLDNAGSPPARGVSVHFVITLDGRIVQMLPITHACGGLNPADRSTNKPYYGHDILVAVLGAEWTDPNAVSIQIEIEGFADSGPNPKQVAAIPVLVRELRELIPTLRGAFGHADQTDYKACPGTTVAMRGVFDAIGGHGIWENLMPPLPITYTGPSLVSAPGGPRYDVDGKTVLIPKGAPLISVYSPYKVSNGMRAIYRGTDGSQRIMLTEFATSVGVPPDDTAAFNSGVEAATAAAHTALKVTG
jgi:hypothetical protein